jgi:hypothetical protein
MQRLQSGMLYSALQLSRADDQYGKGTSLQAVLDGKVSLDWLSLGTNKTTSDPSQLQRKCLFFV